MRIDRDIAELDEAERIAVRRGLGDRVGAEIAADAGAVLDHEALAQRLAEMLGRNARGHVHQPARGGRDHQANGFGRIVLRRRAGRRGQRPRRRCGNDDVQVTEPVHGDAQG